MVIIGDVIAVIATIAGICISEWALMLGVALLFPQRAGLARDQIAVAPWKALGIGFAIMLVLGTVALALLGQPIPIGKLMGWTILLVLFSVGAIGASGIALLAAERMRVLAPDLTIYGSLSKSAIVLVVAGIMPLIGWFLIAPAVILVGLGAGVQALFSRVHQPTFQ